MSAPAPLSGPSHLPADGAKPEQLVVLLHGYGADGNDLIGLAPVLSQVLPKAGFFSANAPYPCEMSPFGRQWFSLSTYDPEMLRRDPSTMAPVLQQMREGAEQAAPLVDAYLDGLMEEYGVAPEKLALIGFSQGTMMSLHVGLRRAEQIGCIIGFSGAMLGTADLATEIKSKPPVVLVHGDADPVVPVEASRTALEALTANGVSAQMYERPGLQHGIDEEGLRIAAGTLLTTFQG